MSYFKMVPSAPFPRPWPWPKP